MNIYLPKMGTAASAATVEVLNLHGQVVHSSREAMVTNSLVQLNTQNWLAGQYLVRFATGDFIVTKPLAIFR